MQPIPVILDTDIGTDIDDTWALAMLLNCPEVDPRLVLTVGGDTHYRARLAAKFLQAAGRPEIPVGIGIGHNPDKTLRLQEPWLEDYDLVSYPGRIHADGVPALVDIVMSSPKPVTIIAIGAATNLKHALEIEPRLAAKCRFVGMYGSIYRGYDGRPGATAEANVSADVPALRRVLAAPWLAKLITPLDTCGLVTLTAERFRKIRSSRNPALVALMENYRIWARLVTWMKVDFDAERSSTLFDTVAVYLAYSQELLEMEPLRLRITDEGLTVPDPAGEEVLAALRWRSLEAFCDHLLERLKP